MKKINAIISAAVVLAMSTSCVKEVLNPESGSEGRQFTISVASETAPETGKTTLDPIDSVSVLWESGDAISILYGTENKQFTTTGSGATADFTGTADPAATDSVYAVYPYAAGNAIVEGTKLRVTIPDIQYARVKSYPAGANIAVGKVVDDKVRMYNVGGLIKLPIAGSDITSVTIRAKYDSESTVIPLSGTFDVDFEGKLTTSTAYSTSHIVKLLPPVGNTVFAPGTYYIAVAAVSMAQGFDIIYTKETARGVKSTSNACNIQRAHIKPIPAQDGLTTFTIGRFIEFIASTEDRKAVQPFTEKLSTTSTISKLKVGTFYQNCPEEYMYVLDTASANSGFYLASGTGKNGIFYDGDENRFYLPSFVHKTLSVIELRTTPTGSPSRAGMIGRALNVSVYPAGSTSRIGQIKCPWNGIWWTASSYGYGYGDGEFTSSSFAENTSYYMKNPQIRKMTLFYAGADVEEVTSVKASIDSVYAKANLPEEISGTFKSWNYGDGATYVAGLEFRRAVGGPWTRVDGIVTGQTFKASLPDTLGAAKFIIRPWAGVDGATGAKFYGEEHLCRISEELTEKTLTYYFLSGEPSSWGSTTTAVWPFAGDAPTAATHARGTTVNIYDAAGNLFVADYTLITNTTRSWSNISYKGRGWRIRNSETVAVGATVNFNEPFQLHLPKFETLRLESVTISTLYTSADYITIVDASGTVLTGGGKGKPSGTGISKAKTWTLTGTAVNTVYRIKTVPYGDYTNNKTSASSQGFQFEPASIVLHYVKP